MMRGKGPGGLWLLSWSETEIDGQGDPPSTALSVGSYWRWFGGAVDIRPAAGLPSVDARGDAECRRRQAAAAAKRVVGRALGRGVAEAGVSDDDRTFTVTDGRDSWIATLIFVSRSDHPLILFADAPPPEGVALRIDWIETRPEGLPDPEGAGVVCYTPGTLIETTAGPQPVEDLSAGDKVHTLDGGAMEIVWTGSRTLLRHELQDNPGLAPVRIRAGTYGQRRDAGDLIVSPDHRLLIRGSRHGGTEVLVAARDLLCGGAALREACAGPVTYVHFLLEAHHVVLANGFETESFHPASAALDLVPEADRLRLYDVMPVLGLDPASYGPTARPVLNAAEAALLSAA